MSIAENLAQIKQNIAEAKTKSPNPAEGVTLVVVSKMHEANELQEVLDCEEYILGENRVQEMLEKYEKLPKEVKWHLIGHLQTNKVKYIYDKIELLHSLDSVSLAEEISKQMSKIGGTMPCLVQVNVAGEEQKFGLKVEEAEDFILKTSQLPGIKIMGLMHIAPNYADKEMVRPLFKQMYELFISLKAKNIPNTQMRYLSMGMSGDYEIAVEEGSNMVRIGSAVFKTASPF